MRDGASASRLMSRGLKKREAAGFSLARSSLLSTLRRPHRLSPPLFFMPCFGISLQVSLRTDPAIDGRGFEAWKWAGPARARGEGRKGSAVSAFAFFFFCEALPFPLADRGSQPPQAPLLPPSAWPPPWPIAGARRGPETGWEGPRRRSLSASLKTRSPSSLFTGCLRRLGRRPAARLPRVPALAIPEGAAGAGAAGHATRCAQGVFVKRSDDRRRGPMRQRGPRSFASPSHAAHAHHTSPLLLGRAPAAGVGPGPVPAAVHAGRGRGKKGVGEEERRPLSDSEWRGPPAPDARCRPRIQDRGEI